MPPEHTTPFKLLQNIPAIERRGEHGGTGRIHFRRLWDASEFTAPIDFVDFTVIPPGSTIGRHEHNGNEEIYLIMAGRPLMRLDGIETRLVRGDTTVVHSGQWHSLVNDTDQDVEIFVVQVSLVDPITGDRGS